ncbi:helicase-associated domain-containing protein [Hamadaea tsunoensis]|uniref:helicase-associated domain-containing protein n=1 Tax=Hamadaea tsunoensis TaxID=53368 RepID=UPI00040EE40B|nr:helicase-associated domain-containing protein [Hamadaea tsunoensis]
MTFFAWLCGLDKTELGRVIAHRPESVLLAGPPRDRAALASLLQHEALVAAHLQTAHRPVHDVVDMVAALGGQSTIEALAKAFDLAADDHDLADAVAWLTTRALAWTDAQGLHLLPTLMRLIPHPHGLGVPARTLLEAQTVAELTAIASRWGLPPTKPKARLVDTMNGWLTDPDNVRQLLRTAPAELRDALDHLVWDGPVTTATQAPAVAWALKHGLVYHHDWTLAQMPGEVGRALRGPGWRPTFTPHPPDPPTVTVAPAVVARESAAAALALLDQVGTLVAECARRPLPALKTGGIGVRELRRLAKTVGCDERSVRLCLEVAFEAGLLDFEDGEAGGGQLLATAAYDVWLANDPAARFGDLLTGWRELATEPWTGSSAETRVAALIEPDDPSHSAGLTRRELLAAAGRLPHDRGLVSDDGLAPVIAWQLPKLPLATATLASLWQEARALGIAAHGTLSSAGRALAADDDDALLAAARDLVGAPTTSAIFQADLTVIVPGIPDYALARLLDSAADRESRGGALIWRFSASSVRRALDAGATCDELAAQLIDASGGGVIPQPLAYLIADIGRQYGRVRVRDVGCVIHGVEETLLTELLTAKALRGLGLTRLAPTVLAAASPQAETLAALRAAGYFPAAEQADGNPQKPTTAQPRAHTGSQQTAGRGPSPLASSLSASPPFEGAAAGEVDAYQLAAQLCGRPPGKEQRYPMPIFGLPFDTAGPGRAPFRGLDLGLELGPELGFGPGFDEDEVGRGVSDRHAILHRAIEEYADSIDPDGSCALATAIELTEPVRVTYRPAGSRTKIRVMIVPETLAGGYVRGHDVSSGSPVKLRLGDIERVHPM